MHNQSVRSEGEYARPIERLVGSGHNRFENCAAPRIAQNHGGWMLLNFAPCYRRRTEIASMDDSQPKRSAMNSWNRFSFAQVTSGTLWVADHICRDLALTLANSNSPAAG
jgi:hypothetical protein